MLSDTIKNVFSAGTWDLRSLRSWRNSRPKARHRAVGNILMGDVSLPAQMEALESRLLLSAVTKSLTASQDTTIYQQDALSSNGSGQFLVTGDGVRGLVRFDVASAVPAGSTVLDAVLTLNLGDSDGSSAEVGVAPLTRAWGEAASDAPGNEHQGAAASPFDATWQYAFYDGAEWNTPGGDFGAVSAQATVTGIGAYEWFSDGLVADVQAWVDDATSNFGWTILSVGEQLKAFVSKDAPGDVLAPKLEITYELPPGPPQIVEGRLWNDINGDGLRSDPALIGLDLNFQDGNDYFDAFGGQEYWLRSGDDGAWYYLTEDGNLTLWTGFAGELKGDVVATLDPVYYLQPTLLFQDNRVPEEWLDGWTVELLNSDGDVVDTTVTAGRDLNNNGVIESELEGGFYKFIADSSESYTVRQVIPENWTEIVRIELESTTSQERAVNSRGFYFRGSYHQNYGGLNEKWIYSDSHGWHFVTPDGRLLEWDGESVDEDNPLSGQLLVIVGAEAWADPTILFDGSFDSQQSSQESPLTRIDFGNQATQTVKGRVWLDFFPNGTRDHIQLIPDYYELYPEESLGPGEEWFYDFENDDWYVIDKDGLPSYWGKNENDDDDYNRPGGGGQLGEFIESEIEPWVNHRTVQLIDSLGNVVASTESKSIDWDANGLIDYEAERGWYVFEDVPVGEYVIRTITNDDWKQTAPIIDEQSDVIQTSRELGLHSTGNDFLNWGGQNERWLKGKDSQWYYILQNGDVFQWERGTGIGERDLAGTLILELDSTFYSQLELLTNPDASAVTVNVKADESPLELLFGNHQLLDTILDYGV